MNKDEKVIQERDWQYLHDRITVVLDRFGEKNYRGLADYWLVDDNFGWNAHLLEIQNLDLFQPDIVGLLQRELSSYPAWRIEMGAYAADNNKDTPGMGIIIYPDEIIDELQCDYLPERFRDLIFGTIPPPPESAESIAEKVRKLMKPRS